MKTTKYIILTLAAMAALSCARMDEQVIPEESGVLPLSLEVRCGGLETRTPGDDNYNENTIKHVDYFFFADEAGTQPLGVHGRATAPTSGRFLIEFDVAGNSNYAPLKGTSYVYILANYSGTVDHANTNPTLEDILGWPVNKALYADSSLSDCFVMDSYNPESKKYTVQLSPSKKDDVLNEANNNVMLINLSRLAVKLTLTLNFDPSIQTTDSFGNAETWTPEPEHTLEIYYVNALNNTTVQANPVTRSANTSGSYFSYPTSYPFTPAADNSKLSYTTDPVYTYPQTWTADDNGEPYFKLHMSWRSTVKDVAQFFYKIPVHTNLTLDRNCWYQAIVQVGVLGGTEEDYVVVTGNYCVADWAEPAWFSGSGLNSAKYFYVPGDEYHIYGEEGISIPYYCNATVNTYFTNITYKNYNGDNGATETISKDLGETDGSSVTVDGDEYSYILSPDGENKVVRFTHTMKDIYVQRDITLMIVNSENSSQNKEIVIHQHPAIELKKAAAGDVFVNGYFARVANAVDRDGNTLGQSSNGFYHCRTGWNNGMIRNQTYGSIWNGSSGNSGSISTNFYTTDITITAFSNNNNSYDVKETTSTSNFNNTTNHTYFYKIGDPRVTASSTYNNWSLDPYMYDESEQGFIFTYWLADTDSWKSLDKLMICGQDFNSRNIVAPRFLVSSALNAMSDNELVSFDDAVKRAATYQEAGYPAGRWRLPTEAEMAFIVARQNDKTIPDLYDNESVYWSGSGRVMSVNSTQGIRFRDRNNNEKMSCRFVYDLWFWGDQPANTTYVTNQYHPNGHEVSYK